MTTYRDFDSPDAFTTTAVGRPGERIFLIQVRGEGETITVKCEKSQVAAIAHYVRELLSDLPNSKEAPLPEALIVSSNSDVAFVVGPIGVAYDRELDRIVIHLDEMVDLNEEGEPLDDVAASRIRGFLTRAQALAFCDHADSVVEAGRPNCRWCGLPMNIDGHPCPRMN